MDAHHLAPAALDEVLVRHATRQDSWKSMDVRDRTGSSPVKATLLELAKLWLQALLLVWNEKPANAKKLVQSMEDEALALTCELPEEDFHQALLKLRSTLFCEMLWGHPRTKGLVRPSYADRHAFVSTPLPEDLNEFDVPAVVNCLANATASDPSVMAGRHASMIEALSKLGHFTSKPTHTSASPIGIVLGPGQKGMGPYLTAGLLLEKGHAIRLDQAMNDNTGKTTVCLEALNADGDGQADQATVSMVQQLAAQLYADGYEHGTQIIDPRLRQILLPAQDGRYRALTPLTSMGLSAYLHSHWQREKSYAQLVFYGFSSTAINNFTAIRKVGHALEPERSVTGIPNRALVFDVPRIDEAHTVLARVRHLGYRIQLPKAVRAELFAQYQRHTATLRSDSVRAIELERRICRSALALFWLHVLDQRDQCCDALGSMNDDVQEEVRLQVAGRRAIDRFLVAGMDTAGGASARELTKDMALLLWSHLARLKDSQNKTLGLGTIDRQRFMRWAPKAIALLLSQR
jgi:hypothetical protein